MSDLLVEGSLKSDEDLGAGAAGITIGWPRAPWKRRKVAGGSQVLLPEGWTGHNRSSPDLRDDVSSSTSTPRTDGLRGTSTQQDLLDDLVVTRVWSDGCCGESESRSHGSPSHRTRPAMPPFARGHPGRESR